MKNLPKICCGTCRHVPFDWQKTPTGRYKSGQYQPCLAEIPLPVLPSSCDFQITKPQYKNLNFLKQSVSPLDGQDCSFFYPKEDF